MRMINTIRSFFSNNNTYNQTSIETQNNYSSETETLLKSLDGYFYDGQIVKTFELIDDALKEHGHKESKYHILLKKVEYFLELRNLEKANSLLNLIKKDYSDYIDVKYKESLLTIYSSEKKEKEYFELVKEIKDEKEKTISDNLFKIIYFLNSGNLKSAKEIYESMKEEEKAKNYLTAGHIYSNLFNVNKDQKDLEKANVFYQKVLDNNPKFINKLHIKGFYVQNILNEFLGTRNDFDKKQVIEYKSLLETFFEAKKYANKYYINELINFYAHLLIILEQKDNYIQFYEDNIEVLFEEHCLHYYSQKGVNIEHEIIQAKIKESDRLLFNYASLMIDDRMEQTKVIKFFERSLDLLLSHNLLIYLYLQGKVNIKEQIIDEVRNYIESNKKNSFEMYFSYLIFKYSNKNKIENEEVDFLLELLENRRITFAQILEVVDFLEKIKKPEYYIKIAISKINQFEKLTNYIFRICWRDRELKLEDFELFINNIDTVKYNTVNIADIYFKYNRFDKALEYYKKVWEKQHSIDNAMSIINSAVHNFERFKNRIDEDIENEALFYLHAMQKELSFNQISLLSYCSLVVNKDINNAFGIINKKILGLNVFELDNQGKQNLASLYFNSTINFRDDHINNYEKNTIYYKNKHFYLDKELFTNIDNVYIDKFNIVLIDKIEIHKIKDDKTYEKRSLFHFIVNEILETIDSPHFKVMKVDWGINDPIEDFRKIISNQTTSSNNLLEKYSKENEIGFWTLSNGYDKYFGLIAKLLEDEKINFNSCRFNYKDEKVPKLLTLSSMIFLNYIDKLDDVLKKDDIFIQKTTFNWLLNYIEDLEKEDEIFNVFFENGTLYKDIVTKEQIEKFTNRLRKIINNIAYVKIIDDSKASLPYKEAFSLSEYIGIQEYQAIALSYQQNYQIITEDRMLEVVFETFRFNTSMVSNSLSLLDRELVVDMAIDLHNKKYKYIFDGTILKYLGKLLTKSNIVNTFSEKDIGILKILNDYGWLDNIKKIYEHEYKVKYPKVIIPQKGYIVENIEYLFKCIE